ATVTVPTAISIFPSAPVHLQPAKALLERKYSNILRYNIAPKGGEFAALENSQHLATEIFSFVEAVEAFETEREE
ncbi:juvenile hormone epoxide hydrolase 1-like protein, partial [Aphelenchoides avenae]